MLSTIMTLALVASASALPHDRAYYEEKFFNWMKEHKQVARDGAHFRHMIENFIENDMHIEKHNAAGRTWTLGHSKFSHMSDQEVIEFMKLQAPIVASPSLRVEKSCSTASLPANHTWRYNSNVVTPVKDQGQCGSCWSFATTGSVEGVYGIKHGKSVSLSEEQLVECDSLDSACNGGFMNTAYTYLKRNQLATEAGYPYTSGNGDVGSCKTDLINKYAVEGTSVKGFEVLSNTNDCEVMNALVNQPMAIALYASSKDFSLYKSGVVTATDCPTEVNHGVLLVGYGTENGIDYYEIKNSWGTAWGDAGYIKLGRGPQYGSAGNCGMFYYPTYPTL